MLGVRGWSCNGATAAEAPPTSEKVSPAAPSAGTDFVTRPRFEVFFTRGILASSISSKAEPVQQAYALRILHARLAAHLGILRMQHFEFMLMNELLDQAAFSVKLSVDCDETCDERSSIRHYADGSGRRGGACIHLPSPLFRPKRCGRRSNTGAKPAGRVDKPQWSAITDVSPGMN
jgi:hypothetical protein